jgi:hypothetical protein
MTITMQPRSTPILGLSVPTSYAHPIKHGTSVFEFFSNFVMYQEWPIIF